jgi:hypothetical protein
VTYFVSGHCLRDVIETRICEDYVVYYESRKRELRIRLLNEGRCDERLKARVEESTCLTYTGSHDKEAAYFFSFFFLFFSFFQFENSCPMESALGLFAWKAR